MTGVTINLASQGRNRSILTNGTMRNQREAIGRRIRKRQEEEIVGEIIPEDSQDSPKLECLLSMDRAEAGRDRIRELPLLALNVFLSQGLSTKANISIYMGFKEC